MRRAFINQWLPDVSYVEQRFPADALKQLEGMGHKVEAEESWSDGECIMIDPKRGDRLGASDKRNNGRAMGSSVGRTLLSAVFDFGFG